jgi:hypothetical protein
MYKSAMMKISAVVMGFAIGVASPHIALSGEKDVSGLQLEKPVRVLYLGDSLTDYDRGSNHVDQVQANGTVIRVWQPGHYEQRTVQVQ